MAEPDDYCDRCMSTGYLLTGPCPDCGREGESDLEYATVTTDDPIVHGHRWRQERDDALAELAQWRANHDDQVRRKQAVQAMYETERAACAEWERQWNDAAEEIKRLREENGRHRAHLGKVPQELLARVMRAVEEDERDPEFDGWVE